MRKPPSLDAKYVYGIIRQADSANFSALSPVGGDDALMHMVSAGGLAAIVSDAAVPRYEVTRANMMAHEHVIEAVAAERTILPMRFGTIDSVAGLTQMLTLRAAEFDKALTLLDGKIEVEIKAMWRDKTLPFTEIADENAPVRRLRDRLNRQGSASQSERVELGKLVEAALIAKRQEEGDRILAPLRRIAERFVENKLLGDVMVLNAAFLMSREREAEFSLAVTAVDEALGQRLNFRYFGPLPPYHFVAINREDGLGYVEVAR